MVGQRREVALSQIQALTAFPPTRKDLFPQKSVPAKIRSRPFNPCSRRRASPRLRVSFPTHPERVRRRSSDSLTGMSFFYRLLSRGVAPCFVLCGLSARILSSCALSVRPVLSLPLFVLNHSVNSGFRTHPSHLKKIRFNPFPSVQSVFKAPCLSAAPREFFRRTRDACAAATLTALQACLSFIVCYHGALPRALFFAGLQPAFSLLLSLFLVFPNLLFPSLTILLTQVSARPRRTSKKIRFNPFPSVQSASESPCLSASPREFPDAPGTRAPPQL